MQNNIHYQHQMGSDLEKITHSVTLKVTTTF